ncbi:MAG: terpene cyclase/mutase family protein [Kiritimatiellae bacterium]|nr:terpene cyclase/mutase family protein [Kiritimatiellia bacterium]MDD4024986.1 terpene cyclase/mutase family protein [Kiritimatiellia bacterium]MDD4622140.1 terpene cyclase/mutase family protein [Kiritimatiellia bacterium]
MSSNVDMSEVDIHLAEIARMYTNDSFISRMKVLFAGIKAPRQSKAYKLAVIELQRLSAPFAAVMLPMLAVGLLVVMSSGVAIEDQIIETQVLEAEELKDLDKIEEFKKPEEQIQDIDIDIPIDSPDVDVQSDAPDQPMSPQPQAFDAVMMVKSPVILKNIYGSTRNTGTRGTQLVRFGGDKHTEEAVLRALRWLKKNQNKDGSWSRNKVAMTGLAILTFLSHGEKPGESVEFGPTVQAALEYLMRVQNKTTGRIPGNYDHPIAAYALCEAYGMTLNPNVKVAAEKSLDLIIKGQHPTGGWTYNMDPNPDKETGKYRDDTSYMGWCAQALKAAHLARLQVAGLDKAIKLAIKGFKANAHPAGGFGYTSPGRGGLTSVGTLCMQLLGASNEPEVKKSLEMIGTWHPIFSCYTTIAEEIKKVRKEDLKTETDNPMSYVKRKVMAQLKPEQRMFYTGSAQYYYYYATQCKFHEGGKHWENWNKIMKPSYVKTQQIERNAIKDAKGNVQDIGWWTNVDVHSDRPVMDTCLAALQLMVYYRYLPTTSKEAVQVEEELSATSVDSEDIKVDTGNL